MKKILKYAIVSALMISLSNCTNDFEKINSSPDGVTEQSLTQMNNHIGGEFRTNVF